MEPVTKPAGTLMVAIIDQAVWIKISGRVNFTFGPDLMNLVNELWQRGYRRFVLELCDCIIMDSTVNGVLAGIGLKFAEAQQKGIECSVELANPNFRVSNGLEELGVAHLFKVIAAPDPEAKDFEPLTREKASRVEVTRTCLEAHRILMNLNPENVGKFKEVAQFLAEDLKKLEQKNGEAK